MLSVNGKIAAEEVLVDLDADWPDYVFQEQAMYCCHWLKSKTTSRPKGHLCHLPKKYQTMACYWAI
ncbi:MAG: hypothetical protein IPP37_17300 [Saprospiraceae bacterium]|nr:hypothetical protein [Saprospiraceae bacterium]